MPKVLTPAEAAALIPDGASVMVAGFQGAGAPMRITDALLERGVRDLTIISNDIPRSGGVGALIEAGRVRKIIASFIGSNAVAQQKMIAGDLEVEFTPQGTFVERIRAGGAGLGGILTPTGLGTMVEECKRIITVAGKSYLLEEALRADFALIHAHEADYAGNLTYRLTAQNFNPVMAMAADVVIAEATEFVPVGYISPDHVRTPGVLVDYIIERAI